MQKHKDYKTENQAGEWGDFGNRSVCVITRTLQAKVCVCVCNWVCVCVWAFFALESLTVKI